MEKDKLRNLRLKLDIELAETTHSGNAFQILGHIEEYRVCGRTVFFSWKNHVFDLSPSYIISFYLISIFFNAFKCN